MPDESDKRVVDIDDEWRLTLEVEGGWAGAYPPPLPNELEAELQPLLGESVAFIPSALDDGDERRVYRFHTDPALDVDQVLAGVIQALETRLARTPLPLTIGVRLRRVDGPEAVGEAHPPAHPAR